MVVQAFQFALDLTWDEARVVRRQFGGRRYAHNWAVRTMKADIAAYRATGVESAAPSAFGLRKRWNQVKDTECVDDETGEVWWPEVSKEAFADGIAGAVDAYWNWQTSRAGSREGRRMGFPRFKKKGRDRDRVTFTTGAIRVEPDRRHVTLPRIGTVRVQENTRRLRRLIAKERARILAATLTRKGRWIVVAFRVLVARPQQPHVARPDSTVGVDVGVRVLATVGTVDGTVFERVPNPRALDAVLKELRHLGRERSRRTEGSRGYHETQQKLTRAAPWATRPAGTGPGSWSLTAGTPRRRLATSVCTSRASAGPSTGPATSAAPGTSVTTTPPSTSRATRQPPNRLIAPSAQSGPPSSVEPTVRPGLARQVARKRGREAGVSLPNNPETGCLSDETHVRSPEGYGRDCFGRRGEAR